MLDAHPDLAIPPETGFLTLADRVEGMTREQFLEAVTRFPPECPMWEDFGIPVERYRAELAEIEPFSADEGFRAFYRLYAQRLRKRRWGDKTPVHTFHLEAIQRLLPELHVVHIVRDGRDVCLSWRRTWFRPSDQMRELAAEWQRFVLAGRLQGERCSAYLEVRFEELVRAPEPVLRSICDFLALDFDPRMLRYYERVPERLREHRGKRWLDGTKTVTQAQRWEQQRLTRFPPDETRAHAWASTMSAEEQRAFLGTAGDTLQLLGYPAR